MKMDCRRCIGLAVFLALVIAALGFIFLGSATTASAATLTWQDNATNELGYKIERQAGPCATTPEAFTEIGSVGISIATYVDATPVPGNRYCYRVRAWNFKFPNDPQSTQYSAYSNKADYEFPFPPPGAAPGQLTVAP